jgi:hypothetical protein
MERRKKKQKKIVLEGKGGKKEDSLKPKYRRLRETQTD